MTVILHTARISPVEALWSNFFRCYLRPGFDSGFDLFLHLVPHVTKASGRQLCKGLLLSIEVEERSGRCSNYSEVFATFLRCNSNFFPSVFSLLCLRQLHQLNEQQINNNNNNFHLPVCTLN